MGNGNDVNERPLNVVDDAIRKATQHCEPVVGIKLWKRIRILTDQQQDAFDLSFKSLRSPLAAHSIPDSRSLVFLLSLKVK
jgi:hypothetical protein